VPIKTAMGCKPSRVDNNPVGDSVGITGPAIDQGQRNGFEIRRKRGMG
jgi:hypothetical protein